MKNKLILSLLFASALFASCSAASNSRNIDSVDQQTNSDSYFDSSQFDYPFSSVEGAETKEEVFNTKLEYELKVPDSEISYNVLWTGYDLENKFGPKISSEFRFFTYLTYYSKTINDYYFLYLPKTVIDGSNQWLMDYEKSKENDLNNYHFVSNKNVLDGKYLLYAQKNNINDYLVYRASDFSSVPFLIDNYQLAICLQAKELIIKENVSTGHKINKSLTAFRRFELFYDESSEELDRYYFDTLEKFNINYVDNIFNYQGNRIEAYPSSVETMAYFYCPIMGLEESGFYKTIRADLLDDKNIILPRYVKSVTVEGEYDDLLNSNSNLFFVEDVYREFKSLFLDAYINDFDHSDSQYRYALFDYVKVNEIIKKEGGIL